MTVLIALRNQDKFGKVKVVMGADSKVTTSSNSLVGLVNSSKLLRIKKFCVGICGTGPLLEVLEDIRENKKLLKRIKMNNREDARKFGKIVYKKFKELLEESISDTEEVYKTFAGLLIGTPEHIFVVFHDLSVYEFEEYYAMGIGDELATGVIVALLNQKKKGKTLISYDDLEEIAGEAVLCACKTSIACGEPVEVISLK
jgi:ATP-dependent protease HslVU (ClpYQ) peptidase subunit